MDCAILLIAGGGEDRARPARAFFRAGAAVRLCHVPSAEEAEAYLSGTGIYANPGAYPPPRLMLLDLELPDASGLAILGRMQARGDLGRGPVIVRAAAAESAAVDRAYALGANSVLLKTLADDALVGVARGIASYAALASDSGPLPVLAQRLGS